MFFKGGCQLSLFVFQNGFINAHKMSEVYNYFLIPFKNSKIICEVEWWLQKIFDIDLLFMSY